MSVNIVTTENFRREAKKLLKKYNSLKAELQSFQDDLCKNPTMGALITENVYKIRLGVKSKGKGKSGGLRIITYIHVFEKENGETDIYMLSIYDKSEYENISETLLANLIEEVQNKIQEAQHNRDEQNENTEIESNENLTDNDNKNPTKE